MDKDKLHPVKCKRPLASGAISVNTPKCPFMVYHRDGAGRADGNRGSAITYYPNSYGALQGQSQYKDPALALDGPADIYDFREDDNNYFEQPGKLFRHQTTPTTAVTIISARRPIPVTTNSGCLENMTTVISR